MEESMVVVISRSIVTRRNVDNSSCSKKKIHLTPWDLSRLRFGYLQRGLLFPKPDTESDIIISRLQTSLSVALDHFYPLAGRLVKVHNNNDDDDTVSYFISCDGSGVEFVHAIAKNIEVSDVLRLPGSVSGFFSSFFPATGIRNYNGVKRSLLMVQVTEMKDGIFIGFGYNSTVADGSSIWRFLKTWSEICSKHSRSFEHPLVLKGWFFDTIEYPIYVPDPETNVASNVTSSDLQEKMFHFTKENVSKLEAKANNEAEKISSIQAVLGYIWCAMVKDNGMSRDEVTHCRLPINMRGRLNPPLEEECFGNVSPTGIVTVTVGELLDHGLGWAALRINEMERLQTDENVKRLAEEWVKNAKVIPVSVGSKDLVVTNSHRFDVYGNDFGWGKPIAARAGPPYVNGRLVVYQGVEEGSLDFQACLHPQVMEKLLVDVDFNEYVSIEY